MWVSSAVWWSTQNVSDQRNRRRKSIAIRIAINDGSISSRVLKYRVRDERSRWWNIDRSRRINRRRSRAPPHFVVLRSIRSTIRHSTIDLSEGQTDDHDRIWIFKLHLSIYVRNHELLRWASLFSSVVSDLSRIFTFNSIDQTISILAIFAEKRRNVLITAVTNSQ